MEFYIFVFLCADIRKQISFRSVRKNFQENVSRKHFITRQDCINISRKVRDYTIHRHHNDAISVDRIVKELSGENPNPVLVYKRQGIVDQKLESSTFLLVLMTEFQTQMFNKYAGKILCLDTTHCTNQYGFHLLSLVVADEYQNGKPLLWVHSKIIILFQVVR